MEVTIGRMRSWKTGAAVANAKPGKTLWLSRQKDLGRLLVRENFHRLDKVFVDDLDRFDITPKTLHVKASNARDEIARNDEDRRERHRFVEMVGGGRNLNEFVNVSIFERGLEAAGLIQYQRQFRPVWWLEKICNFMSRELGDLLRGCTNVEFKEKMVAWNLMNQFLKRGEIGPFQRFAEPLGDGCVISRCGTLDAQEILRKYDVIIVMGGKSSAGTALMMNHWVQESVEFAENGNSINVVVDEADKLGVPGRGIFSDGTINAILMSEKCDWKAHFIIQTLNNLEPEVQGVLLDTLERMNCHAVGDPRTVETMAKIMGKLDPYEVHHVDRREREFSDGYDQVITREEIPKKNSMAKDVRERVTHLARRRREMEETTHYLGLTDQRLLREQDIAGLGKGERFVRSGGASWFEKVRFLHNPFLWKEVSDRRVDQFLLDFLDCPEFTKTEIQKPKGGPWVVAKKSKKK